MTNPNFVLLAEAMGVHAIRCHNAEELPQKMKEFLEYDGSRPVLMECLVDKNEHVFPMVRSTFYSISVYTYTHVVSTKKVADGKALHELMLHPSLPPIKS